MEEEEKGEKDSERSEEDAAEEKCKEEEGKETTKEQNYHESANKTDKENQRVKVSVRTNEIKQNKEGMGVMVRKNKDEVASVTHTHVSSINRRAGADSRRQRRERESNEWRRCWALHI